MRERRPAHPTGRESEPSRGRAPAARRAPAVPVGRLASSRPRRHGPRDAWQSSSGRQQYSGPGRQRSRHRRSPMPAPHARAIARSRGIGRASILIGLSRSVTGVCCHAHSMRPQRSSYPCVSVEISHPRANKTPLSRSPSRSRGRRLEEAGPRGTTGRRSCPLPILSIP